MKVFNKELHMQKIISDYKTLVRKVLSNVNETKGRDNMFRACSSKEIEFEKYCEGIYRHEQSSRTLSKKYIILFMYCFA